MMQIRKGLAIASANVVTLGLRLMGKGATTLPGKVALKIHPTLLTQLASGKKVIAITGTNGKTTTTHMITEILQSLNYQVITNVSGANLATGITTTFIQGEKIRKQAEKHKQQVIYVIETDEGAFSRVAGKIKPAVVVVTNLFRDQLDRYGEIVKTQAFIAKGLDSCLAEILLNSDDSLVSAFEKEREKRSHFFGMDVLSMKTLENNSEDQLISDAIYCSFCNHKYQYNGRVFGHLGDFHCPNCGYTRKIPEFMLSYESTDFLADTQTPVAIFWQDDSEKFKIPIAGIHNLYNITAAIGACCLLGKKLKLPELEFEKIVAATEHIKPAFGRMEKIQIEGKFICILLVKNPVGLESALSFVSNSSDAGGLYMLLNSKIADGKDVSWLWDVDFESKKYPDFVYVSGERYGDLFLRLVYAGVEEKKLEYKPMEESFALFHQALNNCPEGKCLYILPNYTSMLALRENLVAEYKLKDFWK